jgi:hypothetical protein
MQAYLWVYGLCRHGELLRGLLFLLNHHLHVGVKPSLVIILLGNFLQDIIFALKIHAMRDHQPLILFLDEAFIVLMSEFMLVHRISRYYIWHAKVNFLSCWGPREVDHWLL